MSRSTPRALLFDLGGVLVDIDFGRAFDAWAAHSPLSAAELKQRFSHDRPYELHERGELSAEAYFRHVAATLQLSASPDEIERGWNAIFLGEIAPTRALVEAARRRWPCHAFTNTNASHAARLRTLYPQLVQAFDCIFASHEMGLRKPERAAFEHIAQAIDIAPGDILFFDDSAANVEAAEQAGLQAVWVRSSQDVQAALDRLGALA